MARRSEWSASGPGVNARPPHPSYGPPPSYEHSPYAQRHYESPYGGPSMASYHRGPPTPHGYGGRPSSFQPPPPSHSYDYYDAPPPPVGPPPRRDRPPSPPPRYGAPYGSPSYEYSPPMTNYAPGPPSSGPPKAYSHRGGRGGPRGYLSRTPPSAHSSPEDRDPKRDAASPGRRLPIVLHRQHLKPAADSPAPWQPPPRKERPETPPPADEASEEDGEKKDGDPLALLAKVSSDMETKPGSKESEAPSSPATPKTTPASMAPPTSPLARRGATTAPEESSRASPIITPNPSVTQVSWKRPRGTDDFSAATSSTRRSAGSGPKPITPMPPHYMAVYDERGPPPPHHGYGPPPPPGSYPYYPPGPPGGPPPLHHGYGPPPGYEGGPPGPYGPYAYPHVVERHSFDSQESASLNSQESWRRGPYPPPHQYGGPPPPPGPPEGWYPPTTPYMGRDGPPGPPPPPGPPYVSPYGHPHPPAEEKTILRKKFSWKHYPELERFLISNRDDYLEHSSKNYTAEQKQYNNWLTERLLEVADNHNYAFDPEDFNFVAIRDRIRCYYKSFVQTARKRGMELPGNAHLKRSKMSHPSDESEAKSDTDGQEKPAEKKEPVEESKPIKTEAKVSA
mmetsp:Transcript_5850/g.11958  ORF Transcript_5850/g.11958 Transcript_5850/m.11958 type:complete len:621 (+) Transcript_5850:273-2135(+)